MHGQTSWRKERESVVGQGLLVSTKKKRRTQYQLKKSKLVNSNNKFIRVKPV